MEQKINESLLEISWKIDLLGRSLVEFGQKLNGETSDKLITLGVDLQAQQAIFTEMADKIKKSFQKEFLKDVVNEAEENLVQPKNSFLEVVLGMSNLENYIKPEELKEIKEEKNNYEDSRRRLLNATAKITESLSKNPVFYSLENYHDDGRKFIYNLERRVWTGKIRISKLQVETLRTLNDVSL